MVVLVCGLRGQHAVRRVGLALSPEADPVITPPLMLEDKTAQGTSLRRKVVSLHHVLVSNHGLKKLYIYADSNNCFIAFSAQNPPTKLTTIW